MLSEKDKEEMLADGQSIKRRRDFAKAKKLSTGRIHSLDDYIKFLMDIQKVIPFKIIPKKTIAKFNKL